jgi:hypothetical protein
MATGGKIKLEEGTGGGTMVGFKAPDTEVASDLVWTLPSTDGAPGQALCTDGAKGLRWIDFVTPFYGALAFTPVDPIVIPNIGVYGGYTFTTSMPSTAVTIELISGSLPNGLTLSGDTLSGTMDISVDADYPITMRLTDYFGRTVEQAFTIQAHVGTLSISSASSWGIPDNGSVTPFTLSSNMTSEWVANNPALTYSITSGSLPDGLTLSGDTISGTMSISSAASYPVTLQVADTYGRIGTQTLTIKAYIRSEFPQSNVIYTTYSGSPTVYDYVLQNLASGTFSLATYYAGGAQTALYLNESPTGYYLKSTTGTYNTGNWVAYSTTGPIAAEIAAMQAI